MFYSILFRRRDIELTELSKSLKQIDDTGEINLYRLN